MLTVDFATRHTHTHTLTLPHTVIKISTRICLCQLTRPPPLALPALSTDSVVWLRLTSLGRKLTISLKLHKYLRARAPLFYGKLHSRIWVCATVCVCALHMCVCVCVSSCNKNVWQPALPEGFMIGFQPKPPRKGATKNEGGLQKKATRKINKI